MNQQSFDRLLAAIREVSEDDEAFCDEVRNALGAYIEAELAGVDVASTRPRIAVHLRRCPDCREEYATLRDLIGGFDPAQLPSVRAAQPGTPTPPLAPQPTLNDRAEALLAWASSQLAGWRLTLPALGMALRSNRRDLAPVAVPGVEPAATLQLSLTERAQSFEVTGTLRPAAPMLHGRAARLYRTERQVNRVEALFEESVSPLDRFRFRNVSPGEYVLTFDLPTGEAGVAQLILQSSREGQP